MKFFKLTTAVALASIVPAVMSLVVDTPSGVVQCQPQLITWRDGTAPYYMSAIPGGQPGATAIKTFDTQSGNSFTWTVDIPSGTSLTMMLKDATGMTAYSDRFNVQSGSDNSCLNSSGSASAAPSAQDASVNTANVPTSASTSGTSSMSSVAIQTGTIRPTTSASGVTTTSRPAQASVASTSSSATQNVSRTTTGTTSARTAVSSSGAESSLSGHIYGFVGVVGLVGALFL